jgi:hypothetical protein
MSERDWMEQALGACRKGVTEPSLAFAKLASLLAQAIEAQRAATVEQGAVEDESAVRQDAPKPSPTGDQR